MPVEGDAGIKWGGTPTTHALEQPLRDIQPGRVGLGFRVIAADMVTIEHVTVASGVHEITGVLRYEDSASGLLDALEAGAKGEVFQYWDSLGSGPAYPSALIEPTLDEIRLLRDRQLGNSKFYEVAIRLRRTDGGNYNALL